MPYMPKSAVPADSYRPKSAQPVDEQPGSAMGSTGPAMASNPIFQAVNQQRHMLPGYGGIIGAAVGGIPGAAGGAALGRAAQQATNPMFGEQGPANPLEALSQQAMSGAGGAFNEGGPQALAEKAGPVAQKLMQTALGKYGQPGARAANTAIEERVGPGFRGQAVKQIDNLRDVAANKVNAMLQWAKDQGLWHDPRQITAGTPKLLSDPALTDAERGQIASWNQELLTGHAVDKLGNPMRDVKPIDPVALNRIRQRYDNEAKPVFNAMAKGDVVAPADRLRAQWAKSISDQARSMLQDPESSPNAIPGLKDAQGHISDLINLKQVLRPVEQKSFGRVLPYAPGIGAATIGAALPAQGWHDRIVHGALAGAAASPQGMSHLALLLTQPGAAEAVSRLLQGATPVAEATQTPRPQ